MKVGYERSVENGFFVNSAQEPGVCALKKRIFVVWLAWKSLCGE
jgi:hypothetical protein